MIHASYNDDHTWHFREALALCLAVVLLVLCCGVLAQDEGASDGDSGGDTGGAPSCDDPRDSDGDRTADCSDAFPNYPFESRDSDGDGVGDNADGFPRDPARSKVDRNGIYEGTAWVYCGCNGLFEDIDVLYALSPSYRGFGVRPNSLQISSIALRGDLTPSDEYIELRSPGTAAFYRYLGGGDNADFVTRVFKGPQPTEFNADTFRLDFNVPPAVNLSIAGLPVNEFGEQAWWEVRLNFVARFSTLARPSLRGVTGERGSSIVEFNDTNGAAASEYTAECSRPVPGVVAANAEPLPLVDLGQRQSPITVDENLYLSGPVTLRADIAHSWRGDLRIDLISPDGTVVTVYEGDPLDFGDDVTISQSFDDFRDELISGVWRLRIEDRESGNTGTLTDWSLTFAAEERRYASATQSPVVVRGLSDAENYSCRVRADAAFDLSAWSSAAPVLIGGAPAAPRIVKVDEEDEAAVFYVDVPDDGGLPILEYGVSCATLDGEFTVTASTPVVRLDGLENDVGYLCSSSVMNAKGASPPSATLKVTPQFTPEALPAWLLKAAMDRAG